MKYRLLLLSAVLALASNSAEATETESLGVYVILAIAFVLWIGWNASRR